MKAVPFKPHQIKAIAAIQAALERKQKHIGVEIVSGCGKGLVLAKTVEILNKETHGKILVLTDQIAGNAQMKDILFHTYQGFAEIDQDNVTIETVQKMLRQQDVKENANLFVIFYDVVITERIYEMFSCRENTIIAFTASTQKNLYTLIAPDEVVFSYNYTDAVRDGILTPAMNPDALEAAVGVFGKHLLEQFGYHPIAVSLREQDYEWDFAACNGEQNIWAACKMYKSQVISPSVADSLLKNAAMQRINQKIPSDDIILLMILSKAPSLQKSEIFKRYKIIILDIDNLVFYSKNSPALLKQLSQITYYPIDYIEGVRSEEAELAGLSFTADETELTHGTEKEIAKTDELVQQLTDCPMGQEFSGDYESICERIIRTLFEANYFNRLENQHKTKDEHFRMDLIGSLKINQNSEEGMHPLWRMLVQHYNSHFVVFEFKNYSKEIDQNLIYITEKYLFHAALRNVAFILSRKGFSKSAKFAAESCLKEHGKLILDVTEKDLIKMLKSESNEAADYLLDKLEEFLMGISK